MCRILLARFTRATKPEALLAAFAEMAKRSKSLDGDWQGDGWGAAWIDANNHWQTHTSLTPIWEEKALFQTLPETHTLVAHARSASFPQHKGILAFNQPYISGPYAFVFNGLVRGVTLPGIPGRIGAEKIWHLVQQELKNHPPEEALERVKELLRHHSEEIAALNIGIATPEGLYALNEFSRFPDYYRLHHWETDEGEIICSESLTL